MPLVTLAIKPRVIGQVAGDLPERLRGDGHHDALRALDGAGQVGLQSHLARHLDARQEAVVAAGLADFVQPFRDMPPERDFVARLDAAAAPGLFPTRRRRVR